MKSRLKAIPFFLALAVLALEVGEPALALVRALLDLAAVAVGVGLGGHVVVPVVV